MRRPTTVPLPVLAAAWLAGLAMLGCGASGKGPASFAKTSAPASGGTATLPGQARPPVRIGDKNFTEQFLLGELYRQALVAQGFSVTLTRNIGTTEVTQQALQSGRLDMYPEYLGVWNTRVGGDQSAFPTARAAYLAAQRYAQAHGLRLLAQTPFSDVDAIGVTLAYARQNALRAIGDLEGITAGLTIGGPPQFRRSQAGLLGIEQAYGIVPASFKTLEIGEQYQALDQGTVQAADVSTTDGELDAGRYALLADPEHLFGWGNVVPVVTRKALAAEGPVFEQTINAVSALLSTSTMRQLNARVDVYHQDSAAVAKQFLQANGLAPAG